MSVIAPTPISSLGTVPSISQDQTTFDTNTNTFLNALPTFRTEANALGTNVYNNAGEAATSAAAASASASSAATSASSAGAITGIVAWVNGGTYALNAGAISQINFQAYRKITPSSVTSTDPASDTTNWTRIGLLPWLRKTGTYTAKSFDRIKASTTGGGWSLTFPASPADGDDIEIQDVDGTFHTGNLTLLANGKTIMECSSSYVLDVRYLHLVFVYDSTLGNWRY